MTKTCVWDIDGVLVWHHPTDPAQDWRSLLIERQWLNIWEAFQRSNLWLECLTDKGIDVCEQLSVFMRQCSEREQYAQEIVSIWLEHNTKINLPAYECLMEMRTNGRQCAIASNQDARRAGFLVNWFHKGGLLNVPYFMSCDLGLIKPDTQFYEKIESTLGKADNTFVLIDDRPENIQAAIKIGWETHLITPDFDWRGFREGVKYGEF